MKIGDKLLGQYGWNPLRKALTFVASLAGITAIIFAGAFAVGSLANVFDINFTQDAYATRASLLVLLLMVAVGIAGVGAALLLYNRSIWHLINPFGLPVKQQAVLGGVYTLALLIVGQLYSELFYGDRIFWEFRGALIPWFLWLLPIALATFLQTSAEELVFRGYFQQYLASLIPWRVVYFVIPSAIWASLHIGSLSGFPRADMAAIFSTFVLGIVLADWVERSGSLVGPMMMHFANNFILFAIVGYSLQPSEMQLFRIDISSFSDTELAAGTLISTLFIVAIYALFRPAITRKLPEVGRD